MASVFLIICEDYMDEERNGVWYATLNEEKADKKLAEYREKFKDRKGRSFWVDERELDED